MTIPAKMIKKVQNTKGTNQERGKEGKEYVRELHNGGPEKAETTRLGKRQHDVSEVAQRTRTIFRHEVKNYRIWLTINGEKTRMEVPLTKEIKQQLTKDFFWRREGLRSGIDRVVQWDFVGAPPNKELRDFLIQTRTPFFVH